MGNSTLEFVIYYGNIYYTSELRFELRLTERQVNESASSIQLNVTRSGQFNEIYRPSVEYRISTNGSLIAHGNHL